MWAGPRKALPNLEGVATLLYSKSLHHSIIQSSRKLRRGHLDDGAAAKVGGEEVDVQRGAHEHDAQVGVRRQQVAQQDQQEVREAVPLVDLFHRTRVSWLMLCSMS